MNAFANSVILRRIIDTNVVIRYLVGDGADHAVKAAQLFLDAEAGLVNLVIPEIVLVESVHVLYKGYKLEKAAIVNAMRQLVGLPGVETITPLEVITKGLENFETTNAPWPDALIAAYGAYLGLPEIYSFDGHFDKFNGIIKIEPAKITLIRS
jgi:predicted nucleic-acid-binding protein